MRQRDVYNGPELPLEGGSSGKNDHQHVRKRQAPASGKTGRKAGQPVKPDRIPPEILADVQSGRAKQGETSGNSQLFVKQ